MGQLNRIIDPFELNRFDIILTRSGHFQYTHFSLFRFVRLSNLNFRIHFVLYLQHSLRRALPSGPCKRNQVWE